MENKTLSGGNLLSVFKFKKGNFLILCFFFLGHGVFHFMSHSFSIMLPEVKNTFGINPVQIGALFTVKELTTGLVALPGGIVSDYLRKYRMLMIAICMLIFGAGWLLISTAPFYGLLFVGMVIIAVASSLWHLPSVVELGRIFSHNRGAALAIHGAGGSLGDIVGPMLTGLLLSWMSWQFIISVYVLVPIGMSFWSIWMYFRFRENTPAPESEPAAEAKMDLKIQLKISREIFRKTHIMRVNVVAALRGMCFVTLITFLPLFMKEDLGFSSKSIGFHFGLLWIMGIFASPFMGHLSDRLGRKQVLVPALIYSCLLITLLALIGEGIMFTVILILLGLSVRSDYSLVNATVLDITGNQVASTMLGVMSIFRFSMGAAAPLIAGTIYQYVGMEATLLFVAALFLCSAIIFASVDLSKKA